ncbi:ShlB/FhaC/HecB family hemolysin secretion/activation protein [Phormidesmis sp. 146-35]
MIPNSPLNIHQIGIGVNLFVIFTLMGLNLPAISVEVNLENSFQATRDIAELPTVSSNSVLLRTLDTSVDSPTPASPTPDTGVVNQQPTISQSLNTTQGKVASDDVSDKIAIRKFLFVEEPCKLNPETSRKICKEGKFVFSHEELEGVIKRALGINFSGRSPVELTFAQLLQARSAITQHYVNNGYITSGAYIPEQNFKESEGMIEIAIVEGKLEQILLIEQQENRLFAVVNGLQKKPEVKLADAQGVAIEKLGESSPKITRLSTDEANFAGCLAKQLVITETLNQNRLLDILRLIQESNPRVDFNVELLPSKEVGRNKLVVKVRSRDAQPKSNVALNLAVDNNQSPSVGSLSQQLQISLSSRIPWRSFDQVTSFSFTRSEGLAALDASLFLPENADEQCNSRSLNLRAGLKTSRIITRPFNELDIQSGALYLDIDIPGILGWTRSQLAAGKENQRGVLFSYRNSDSSILGIPFPISSGANQQGINNIVALRPYVGLTRRTRSGAFALRGELSVGGNFSSLPRDDSFFELFILLRGQTQWARLLSSDIVLVLKADMQLAGTSLPALEQLSLGGQDTIRGYRKNLLLTDNGLFSSAELQFTVAKVQDWRIKLIPFMDFGTGWNHSGNFDIPVTNTLWSTGFGLLVQDGDKFSARVDWGIPLIKTNFDGSSLQDQGFYFSVSGIVKF